MKTTKMKSSDNVSQIKLFGRGIPPQGRQATADEETLIRLWLRKLFESRQLTDLINDDNSLVEGKIVIYLKRGILIVVRPVGESNVEITDSVGVSRIFEHKELRTFLNGLDN